MISASAQPEYNRRSAVQKSRSRAESGPRLLSFEYGELLSQSSRFKREPVPCHNKTTTKVEDRRQHQRNHDLDGR